METILLKSPELMRLVINFIYLISNWSLGFDIYWLDSATFISFTFE